MQCIKLFTIRLDLHISPYNCNTAGNSTASYHSDSVHAGDSHSSSSSHTEDVTYTDCVYSRSLAIYTSVGLLLFVMTVSLAIATRIYELKLLGISSIDDYPRILEVCASDRNIHKYL
jgi:hypothetical protein